MTYQLDELNLESTLGKTGQVDNNRPIPVIDFSNFDQRREQIKDDLWNAATQVGFFQIRNHNIPAELISNAFTQSQRFFALSSAEKARSSLLEGQNAGWEYKNQVRPSTGTADQKESYQITLPRMQGLWPSPQLLPEFQSQLLDMEKQAWQLGMNILSCFAEKLGKPSDFFTQAHNRDSTEYQSTLRLLHYLPLETTYMPQPGIWRAGAHSDFDCLTMVFQREGQGGLQVCPGKEALDGQSWTEVAATDDVITCNIGDMLMRWSDDKLKSTLHRVAMPQQSGAHPARYSMAFFCQANKDQLIESALDKYQSMTAAEYLKYRLEANF